METQLIIPTYRRTHNQRTWKHLRQCEAGRQAVAVCDATDAPELARQGLRSIVHPPEITTIAQKRAWIIKEFYPYPIVMFDDDLTFFQRTTPEGPKLEPSDGPCMETLLEELNYWLGHFAHVGVSARGGNNRQPSSHIYNSRAMYVLGYHTKVLVEECELGRIEHREDFDYTLQLLRKGRQNVILTHWACDNKYNEKGGASHQRTIEASNADAYKLEQLHPGFVRAAERTYKASIPRIEVTCYWKKAYESSQSGT